jgi:hypothetical protein
MNGLLAASIAVIAGVGLWIWAAQASGTLEAWDGPFYFSRVVPALAVIAAGCGFLAPRSAWLWPALMYGAQFVVMVARATRPIGPLAPVGFVMMVGLAMLCTIPAYAGAFARRRRDRGVGD